MKLRLPSLFALFCLTLSCVYAQGARQQERVAASFILAQGRSATAAELQEWQQLGELSVSELLARHRQTISKDATTRAQVQEKAARDAYGDPKAAQTAVAGAEVLYAGQLTANVNALSRDAAAYERVMERAYRDVLQRAPFPEELTYWKEQGAVSYVMMIACIENWARRNAPGLMVTVGEPSTAHNSDHLATVRLSPAVADEARAAIGLPTQGERSVQFARNRNVIAPGAERIAAVGGTHFVAAGAEKLVFGRR